jgi:predicted Zn-dependent peptidase
MQALKTTTLSNGLRIASVSDLRARTTTAMVLVGVGSSYETKKENGISHFLEHMCFKGTERRPNSKIIAEEIESMGAVMNAFTDREFTGYFIKGNPKHLPKFVDMLSDIYQHPTFPEVDIANEKGVIIEEINMYEDMPQQKVFDLVFDTMYPDQPAGRAILGTKETVRSFTKADLNAYKHKHYTPENTVIVFSGSTTHAKAVSLTKEYFSMLKKGKYHKKTKTNNSQHKLEYSVLHKPLDQAHFALALRSVPMGHKDMTAVRMLATILGRGMSSRLSLLLREQLGAAYYAFAQQDSYLDHGIFAVAAGIDRTRLVEILGHVAAEFRRLKEEPVSDQELAKGKEYSIGTLRLGLELSDDVAMFYGMQLALRQKVKTPEQLIKEISAVSAKDLMRAAKRYFTPDAATLALVGPFSAADVPATTLKGI